MAATLDFFIALRFAHSLKTILGAEYQSDAAINATAQDLVRWCAGAFIDGAMWTPENQAEWLVMEARENWETWQGTYGLRKLFRSKFVPELPPSNAAVDYGPKPPIECAKCNDTGFIGKQFCDCSMGQQVKSIWGDIPPPFAQPRRPQTAQGVSALQPFRPITEEDLRAASEKHQREKAARAESELPPDTPSKS